MNVEGKHNMSQLMEQLKKEHCDVDGALKRCMDMEEVYMELLRMFAEDDAIDKLVKAQENQDVEDVFFQSHTLKGVYANLGITPLYNLDVPIVETSRAKRLDGLDDAVEILYKAHRKFTSLITKML